MNVSSHCTQRYATWNSTQQKTQYWINTVPDSELSQGLVKRCMSYANQRLEKFPLDYSKVTHYNVCRNEDGYITVSIKGEFGAIKVNGIMIGKGGWPFLDHGIDYDENDLP